MKNLIYAILAASIILGSPLYSQPRQGLWEVSLSGYLGSVSGTYESTSSNNYLNYSSSEQESRGFISLALRPGYFITEGVEIEPEILWTAVEKIAPAYCLTANVAYNFSIPESHMTPFVLVGYGIANAVPVFQRLYGGSMDNFDISVLNVGAGDKIFITERIALRIEYRYQRFYQESAHSAGLYSYSFKETQNFHNVFFGFSIFL